MQVLSAVGKIPVTESAILTEREFPRVVTEVLSQVKNLFSITCSSAHFPKNTAQSMKLNFYIVFQSMGGFLLGSEVIPGRH